MARAFAAAYLLCLFFAAHTDRLFFYAAGPACGLLALFFALRRLLDLRPTQKEVTP